MSGDLPTLIVVAGPNGAGKSTVVERFQHSQPELFPPELPILNPDHLSLPLAGGKRPLVSTRVVEIAREAIDGVTQFWIAQRQSFALETNFSHPSKLELMRAARTNGFQVAVLYVGLSSPELAKSRVEHRVRLGGHDVIRSKIASRYAGGLERLAEAIAIAQATFVYDNSGPLDATDPSPAIFYFRDANEVRLLRDEVPAYLRDWLSKHFPRIKITRGP